MGSIPYDFKAVNPQDYELTLIVPVKSRMMRFVFAGTKRALKKKIGAKADDLELSQESFTVDPKFYSLIKTASDSFLKDIEGQLAGDGIIMRCCDVRGAHFIKQEKDWQVKIIFIGLYQDMR